MRVRLAGVPTGWLSTFRFATLKPCLFVFVLSFPKEYLFRIVCNSLTCRHVKAVDGVPPIKEGYNPATWMLEVTSTSQELRMGLDFAQVYKDSALFQ